MNNQNRICQNCGREVPPDVFFCIHCGHQLNSFSQTAYLPSPAPRKNGSTAVIIALSCVLAVLVAALVCAVVFRDNIGDFIDNMTGKNTSSYQSSSDDAYQDYDDDDDDDEDEYDYYNRYSSTQSYEDTVKENALRQYYIDVNPDSVYYMPSYVDIWNTDAGHILNMRSGPGSKYDLVGQINNGEEVITLYQGNKDYDYVYYPDGDKYGWVLSKYVILQ